MKKISKTNVARLLDKAKVAYELVPYEVDESDLSAVHVAASLGEAVATLPTTISILGKHFLASTNFSITDLE